jgi:hypothetical protein
VRVVGEDRLVAQGALKESVGGVSLSGAPGLTALEGTVCVFVFILGVCCVQRVPRAVYVPACEWWSV